jgi:hypothetical protein
MPKQMDAVAMLKQLEHNVGNGFPDLKVSKHRRRRKSVRIDDADTSARNRYDLGHVAAR